MMLRFNIRSVDILADPIKAKVEVMEMAEQQNTAFPPPHADIL